MIDQDVQGRPFRVLVVGDVVDSMQHHANLLRQGGLEVLTADNPEFAFDVLGNFLPELLVVDISSPPRGAGLIRRIRAEQCYLGLPILCLVPGPEDAASQAMTYWGTGEYAGEYCLSKPVAPDYWGGLALARAREYRTIRQQLRAGEKRLAHDIDIPAWNKAEASRQAAEAALQKLNAELEARVSERTWELVESYNQIQEEENFLRALFEISPVGLALFRIADGQLVNCNLAFARILESPIEALLGQTYRSLIPDDCMARGMNEFEILLQTGAVRGYETYYLTRTGSRVPVRQSLRLVEKKGERLAWLVVEDISERRRRDAVTAHLTRRIATLTGQQLFNEVCVSLRQLLEVDQAFVGRVLPETRSIRVVACSGEGALQLPSSFPYEGTPFEAVVLSRKLVRHELARDAAPTEAWLRDVVDMSSFAALPLTDSGDKVVGVLGVMSHGVFPLPRLELKSVLQLFAVRTTAEMQRISAEQRFHDLFQFSPDAIILADAEGRVRQVNEAAPRLFGYSAAEMGALSVENLMPTGFRSQHGSFRDGYMDHSLPRTITSDRKRQILGQRRGGKTFPLEISLVPVETDQGRWVAAVIRDISERMEAQQKIQASLREKEILLKEIHHRVKNNLQVIVSLLSMQSDRLLSEDARVALRESQNRVRSMALIHERLYRAEDLGGVDFGDYIHSLVSVLYRSYQTDHCHVNMQLDLDGIRLNIDTAMPCGLLINEMVTNAFKHAYIGRTEGVLRVALAREEDRILLSVADDGPGVPPGFDWQASDSLGMMLIQTLSKQIKAELVMSGPPGTCYTLHFKELEYANR